MKPRYSLMSTLVLVTGVCLLLGIRAAMSGHRVTALLQVEVLPFYSSATLSPQSVKREFANQTTLATSPAVLAKAMNDPAVVQAAPGMSGGQDPVAWLKNRLHVAFLGEIEIMELRLVGKGSSAHDQAILEAVIRAYKAEAQAAGSNAKIRVLQPPVINLR